jgi:hypothetical protein
MPVGLGGFLFAPGGLEPGKVRRGIRSDQVQQSTVECARYNPGLPVSWYLQRLVCLAG